MRECDEILTHVVTVTAVGMQNKNLDKKNSLGVSQCLLCWSQKIVPWTSTRCSLLTRQ